MALAQTKEGWEISVLSPGEDGDNTVIEIKATAAGLEIDGRDTITWAAIETARNSVKGTVRRVYEREGTRRVSKRMIS